MLATASSSELRGHRDDQRFRPARQRDLHDPGPGARRPKAPAPATTSSSAYNVTPNVYSLTVNQTYTGTIGSAYGVNQYAFTASAGEQVQLDVISAAGGNVEFDLTGPGGNGLHQPSVQLRARSRCPRAELRPDRHGNGGQGGAYAFELEQTSVTT